MNNEAILISLKEYYRRMLTPVNLYSLPNKYIESLPDAYLKTPESINNKILSLSELAMISIKNEIIEIEEMVDLDKVFGYTLNLYGQMLDVARGRFNDTQYRTLIKAQIACNLSKGDFTSVLYAIRMFLDCGNNYVRITDIPDEICAVKVDTIPYNILSKTGLSGRQVLKLIKRLIPVAVRIEELLFEGTFEFGDSEHLEYDENRGFGDIEQTVGGYFGSVIRGDSRTISMPIDE